MRRDPSCWNKTLSLLGFRRSSSRRNLGGRKGRKLSAREKIT